MACTLDTFALLSVEDVKDHLGLTSEDLTENAFSIYHDTTQSATACTIAISGNVLTLIVTGGANAGTYTYTLTDAANDTLALGVSRAAHDQGLHIPDDIAIIGFDNLDMADHIGLTTIDQSLDESGRVAVELLQARLADPTRTIQHVRLPLSVIERETT